MLKHVQLTVGLFHARGATTENARSPNVERLTCSQAGIPRRRHGHRHRRGDPRRLPREDRRRVRRLPRSACHEPNTHEDPRRLVRHVRFSSRGCPLKLKFHGTDTDSDTYFLADFRVSRTREVGPAAARAARSTRHEPDTHDDPRRLVRGLLPNTRAFPREDVR